MPSSDTADKFPVPPPAQVEEEDAPLSRACDRLASQLGWPAGDAGRLLTGASFQGPAGSVCRLEPLPPAAELPGMPDRAPVPTPHSVRLSVRLSVLLPVLCADLWGPQVDRLMQLQSAVHAGWGWWLGRSTEGLLDLSPVMTTPLDDDWYAVLLQGESLASVVLQLLLDEASGT